MTRTRSYLIAATITLLTLTTACGSDSDGDEPNAQETLSDAERDEINEDLGIAPAPDQATTDAYVAALDAVDPDIVHGKTPKAVDRGRNTCGTIRDNPDDRPAQIQATASRFSSPTHPEGRTPEVAEQILDIVHEHLCPGF